MSLLSKVLRAGEGKALTELEAFAAEVNALEDRFTSLSDGELASQTDIFRARIADGETLDDIAAEAFATVRATAQRTLGMRHFDVQLVGGAALHRGMAVEMRTGEGKTLVSTLPAYLNALGGDGVHIVTVNDYLATRDAEWMGAIHRFLGLEVGVIRPEMDSAARRAAYAADITHGTNNEFGFDYLRDNMAMRAESMVKRGHHYAIVDEVDSILIDEARTPLIISGRVADAAKWYRDFAKIARSLQRDRDYEVDEKKRQVITTEDGVTRVEQMVGVENMFDHSAVDLVHHLDVSLKAKELYQRDVEYLVVNGEVKIVDEFTGRVLDGRRYSEGLHQAIEAKEGVQVNEENQTLATITLQNYFRMYEKLAGMTGTAKTEAGEFKEIYDLDVVEIPTNRPIARIDGDDLVYKTEDAKYDAIVADIRERNERGQPILIGTVSIEKSERLSRALSKAGIRHEVLNAKQHAREAEIVAQAGRKGAVTVATNMAGRGVDIVLGGNAEGLAHSAARQQGLVEGSPEFEEARREALERVAPETKAEQADVLAAGGLYVIGTERHESRRIDNQLRGRSGRQGDPGESRFYLSLEDDLMRRFQGERVAKIMETLRLPDDQPIEAKVINRSVERAQSQVESQNFEIRKNVLKYDEVMNRQREVIYEWRSGILLHDRAGELVDLWMDEVVDDVVREALGELSPAAWDAEEFARTLAVVTPVEGDFLDGVASVNQVVDRVVDAAEAFYTAKREELGEAVVGEVERRIVLSVIDNKWREHLADMDYLRAGINLRAMGNRDPLVEYQNEAFGLFEELVYTIKRDSVRYLMHVEVTRREQEPIEQPKVQLAAAGARVSGSQRPVRVEEKVGRNDPCPCGSGKKYKKCHGAAA